MKLIELIREILSIKGYEFLCSEEFIDFLNDMDIEEKQDLCFEEKNLISLIRLGIMRDMFYWCEEKFSPFIDEAWFYEEYPQGQFDGFLGETIKEIGIGIGKKTALEVYDVMDADNHDGVPDGDEKLEYLSNGEMDTTEGSLWLDTGVVIPHKSKIELWFLDDVGFGPVAGFAQKRWPWSKENRFEFSLLNHRFVFGPNLNWSGFPTKILIQHIYHAVAYNLQPSEPEKRRITEGTGDWNPTIKLFRVGDKYAWKGLQIYRFKVTDGNNVVVADMIPVRHKGKECMYDTVRKKYFYMKPKEVYFNPFKGMEKNYEKHFVVSN